MDTQLHISNSPAIREYVEPVKNLDSGYRQKPGKGGLWTSTWREETQDSEWVEWCVGESYGSPYEGTWYQLTPKPDSKLFVIDGYKDLLDLVDRYPYENRWTHVSINFEALSLVYDGLHLTSRGNRQTHLSVPIDLNAWDCESTVWFRWCFTSVKQINIERSSRNERVRPDQETDI